MTSTASSPRAALLVIALVLALLGVMAPSSGAATGAPPAGPPGVTAPSIDVLSNRADLVSGGDALVEVVLPDGTNPAHVRVSVDGRDVTDAFAVRADGRFLGVVTGIPEGESTLLADIRPSGRASAPPGRTSASITITNHPSGGPVFSGPQLEPWLCTTAAAGLGAPIDEQCNAPSRVDWYYQRATGGALVAYDPANPPTDVGTTTTDAGQTVPFVVRRERGAMNRGIYDVAVLADPSETFAPWSPPTGWNGKVVWAFGPSSGTVHSQGSTQQVLLPARLGAGFMVANSSLNTHGTNSNTVVSAESVMMLKEHITETYGEIRYTIGQGGSGGAIGQHVVANTYPGLIDGLMPALTYPDTYTTGNEVWDCIGLNASTTTVERPAFSGHASAIPCVFWQLAFGSNSDPSVGCGLPADVTYHPVSNPDGVRCTPTDYAKAVWGLRDDGIANSPADNVGVQYGLSSLLAGQITPQRFVDVNAAIGALDDTGAYVPGFRREADPGAVATAYRTGQVTDGAHLDLVPIIDLRASENNGIHTNYHTYALRERLVKANGHADNHVIYSTNAGSMPAAAAQEAFELMDAWLAAIEADDGDAPLEEKVVRNRPVEAVDTCFVGGTRSTDPGFCDERVPYFASPRIAAGGPTTHDNIKCQLQPLDRAAYGDVEFTDEQWALLEATFPDGVCDWSLPAVDEQPTIPWLSYMDGPGGTPIGPEPTAVPGCPGLGAGRTGCPAAP